MSLTLRAAGADDLAAVLDLWRAGDAQPTHTDDVESLEQLLATDPQALIVALDGEEIVGSVIAAWDGWRGSIYRLVVAPSHRRQGLAARLVTNAEDHLRARGARRLTAIVAADDPDAVLFWRASGWEQQHGRLRFVTA